MIYLCGGGLSVVGDFYDGMSASRFAFITLASNGGSRHPRDPGKYWFGEISLVAQ